MITYGKLTTTETTIFTATEKTAVTFLAYTNVGTDLDYVTMHIVHGGDTTKDENTLLNKILIAPQDLFTLSEERIILEKNDTLVALSDSGTVSFTVSTISLE